MFWMLLSRLFVKLDNMIVAAVTANVNFVLHQRMDFIFVHAAKRIKQKKNSTKDPIVVLVLIANHVLANLEEKVIKRNVLLK